ncbi:MAG: riboflavin biosynthesis protein RibF [Oscillospiraceae bacterium]|jgi:riboflavin kinase/FMN adenylyltransferase|nr:riboflavin biosynthesis protein RibF [Oscillospiraceae bacterium]
MAKKTVIALGFFDGIHLGHSKLLARTVTIARELGAEPAMLTFDSHPDELTAVEQIPLITSPEERADLVRELYGIENVIALRFDETLRRMHWTDFAEWLVRDFGAVYFIVGYDFGFGFKAEGTAKKLRNWCFMQEPKLVCDIVPAVKLDGITVSSTYIRQLLLDGEVARANRFLGHRHRLTDVVRFGFALGRTIGAPTINMLFPKGVIVPKCGVYATVIHIDGEAHNGVTNIGKRPTVSSSDDVTVETYILDFDQMVYGKLVTLEFAEFIREEMKFDSVEDLQTQIKLDAESVRQWFAANDAT